MSAELIQLKRVVTSVSGETIRELESLLQDAKQGKVTGLALVAMHDGADFTMNVVGRARFAPVYTLGMIQTLQGLIQTLI